MNNPEFRPKAVIGIDPGKTGGYAVLAEDQEPIAYEWEDEFTATQHMRMFATLYNIEVVALEEVFACKGQSATGAMTFGQNVGFWRGLITGMSLPLRQVKPQVWMRDMGVPNRKKDQPATFKPSFDVAERLFPTFPLRTPKGRKLDGPADALLLASWAFKNRPVMYKTNSITKLFG